MHIKDLPETTLIGIAAKLAHMTAMKHSLCCTIRRKSQKVWKPKWSPKAKHFNFALRPKLFCIAAAKKSTAQRVSSGTVEAVEPSNNNEGATLLLAFKESPPSGTKNRREEGRSRTSLGLLGHSVKLSSTKATPQLICWCRQKDFSGGRARGSILPLPCGQPCLGEAEGKPAAGSSHTAFGK